MKTVNLDSFVTVSHLFALTSHLNIMFDKKALTEKIKTAIIKAESDIESAKEAVRPISPENSIGRVSRMDAINNKGVAEAALRTTKRKLNNLQKALAKIDDASFGKCANCGNYIQEARLMYMPESTDCVRCAARR